MCVLMTHFNKFHPDMSFLPRRSILASLPDIFFPTIAAVNKGAGTEKFGFDALTARARSEDNIVFPVRPSVRLDQVMTGVTSQNL